MFVMVSSTDNPWMIFFAIFLQLLFAYFQLDSDGSSASNENALLRVLAVALVMVALYKLVILGRSLYQIRDQRVALGWWRFLCLGFSRTFASAAQGGAGTTAGRRRGTATTGTASSTDRFNHVLSVIQRMPMEEFKSPSELRQVTTSELKERLKRRQVDFHTVVEREELVDLLVKYRGGPTNNDTCCICCEEYQSGDLLRLLRKCKHEFHLECLDKWAYTSANSDRNPSCPLCNQDLE